MREDFQIYDVSKNTMFVQWLVRNCSVHSANLQVLQINVSTVIKPRFCQFEIHPPSSYGSNNNLEKIFFFFSIYRHVQKLLTIGWKSRESKSTLRCPQFALSTPGTEKHNICLKEGFRWSPAFDGGREAPIKTSNVILPSGESGATCLLTDMPFSAFIISSSLLFLSWFFICLTALSAVTRV